MEVPMNSFDIKKDAEELLTQLLPEVQPIDIEFHNVTYKVHSGDGTRRILKGVSGSFRSGELTAVLGPSGAGKTSLLNLLAGYGIRSAGTDGTVLVNGRPRHPLRFRRMCCYIMQDALVQSQLSVREAMLMASDLKVAGLSREARIKDIMSILTTLGIDGCLETRTDVLSGGQKKRLTIALELVSNPSVLFLDEPTTGLDTHAGKMVIRALAALAAQGRTIICTVHQPSPLEFRAYDNVYVVARGSCVYAGTPSHLVPFLQEAGAPCPTTYSPADYIIELTQMSPEIIDQLTSSVLTEQNQNKAHFSSLPTISETSHTTNSSTFKPNNSPSAWIQLYVLLRRMLLQRWRNKTALRLQFIHHSLSAILIGLTFYGVGNEASEIIQNVKFGMCLCVFFTYTYVMVAVLYFPLEVELVKREYFNNWYGPLPYYISYSLSTLPFMIPNAILFTVICFFTSSQPFELNRLVYLLFMGCASCYCAEGVGLFIGALGNIKAGCILGPTIIGTLFALSIYGLGYGPIIEPYMTVVMKFTFLRYSLAGIWISFFGLEREQLPCSELYCHWRDPALILRDMGVKDFTPWIALGGLLAYTLMYRVLGYIAIRYRLHADLPGSTTSATVFGVAEKVIIHFRKQRTVK